MNGEQSQGKQLSQAAIGRALGIAPPTVTKHKAAGMPVDSIESARAWYKSHTNIAQRKRRPGHDARGERVAAATGGMVESAGVVSVPVHATQRNQDQSRFDRVGGDDFRTMIRASDRDRAELAGLAEEFDSARTREKIAEANLAEMEEAKLRGEYLIKADFERHLFTAGRMLRDTLTNCSRRIGAEVAGTTNPDECEAIIDREHRAALASFAQALRMSLKVNMETPA